MLVFGWSTWVYHSLLSYPFHIYLSNHPMIIVTPETFAPIWLIHLIKLSILSNLWLPQHGHHDKIASKRIIYICCDLKQTRYFINYIIATVVRRELPENLHFTFAVTWKRSPEASSFLFAFIPDWKWSDRISVLVSVRSFDVCSTPTPSSYRQWNALPPKWICDCVAAED